MSPYREPAPIDIHIDPLPRRGRSRDWVRIAVMFGSILIATEAAGAALGACTPAAGPEAAGAGYAAQQLACVDTYADRHNIDACRAKVRAAWGIDAGPEGGW